MKNIKLIILVGLVIGGLVGCKPKLFNIVTNEPQYEEVLGLRFESIMELQVRGVSLNLEGKRKVNYVFIRPPPTIGGHEVVFRETISAGVQFELIGVVESAYFSFIEKYYIVKITSSQKYDGYIVLVDIFESDGGKLGVDPKAFKRF